MSQAILSAGFRGLRQVVRKKREKRKKMACSKDGCNDIVNIGNIFSDK